MLGSGFLVQFRCVLECFGFELVLFSFNLINLGAIFSQSGLFSFIEKGLLICGKFLQKLGTFCLMARML